MKLSVPVMCDFRSTSISFGISCCSPLPFMLPQRFYELPIYDERDSLVGSIYEVATNRWSGGCYPIDPGTHENVPLLGNAITKIDNGYGQLVEVNLTIGLLVKRQLYFGGCAVQKLRGLLDEQTGLIHTNAFAVNVFDPIEVQNTWKKLDDEEQPPQTPVLSALGLVAWGVLDDALSQGE